MPISFSSADRLQITRRQINIVSENNGLNSTLSSQSVLQTQLLAVDDANSTFYNNYNDLVTAYESEGQAMDGIIPNAYLPSDIITSAQFPSDPSGSAIFFSTTYAGLIPEIIPKVNSRPNSIANDSTCESTTMTTINTWINYLLNGITGASAYTTTTLASLSGGPQTGHVLLVTDTISFTNGDKIYIGNGSTCGIYQITAIVPSTSITINSILPSASTIASGSNVNNTVSGFSNAERNTLISGSYQEILTNLTLALRKPYLPNNSFSLDGTRLSITAVLYLLDGK